ncbi:MAG: DUF1330 domain-containing protein [Cohaesibacteraceae bacterium]
MTVYLIANITIRDAEKMEAYAAAAGPTLDIHGGEFIMHANHMETLLGEWSVPGVAMVRFPSVDAARTWYRSPEYQALKDMRSSAADMDFALFEAA